MEQEDRGDDGHHDEFLNQLMLQVGDSALDQLGAIVGFDDLHPGRQAGFKRGELLLHRRDGRQRISAKTHDDDAADHFTFAIQLGDTSADLRPQPDLGHVTQQDWRAIVADT